MSATCKFGHFLLYTNCRKYDDKNRNPDKWQYDNCKIQINDMSIKSHHCKYCQIDYCNDCNHSETKKEENNLNCPAGHKTTLGKSTNIDLKCDKCHKYVNHGGILYGYRICDFDLCE